MNERPVITINKIREILHLRASYSAVERAVQAMGYTLKKKSLYISERDRVRCGGKAEKWAESITPDQLEHLVFLDESVVNTDMTRFYGRAHSSERCVDHAPFNTPQTTTVFSSIRFNGKKTFTTYQGGMTGEHFDAYLKDTLLPILHLGDIIVMDNMRSHHVKAVGELLVAKGMIPLYLPPYSTDLNPIEKCSRR